MHQLHPAFTIILLDDGHSIEHTWTCIMVSVKQRIYSAGHSSKYENSTAMFLLYIFLSLYLRSTFNCKDTIVFDQYFGLGPSSGSIEFWCITSSQYIILKNPKERTKGMKSVTHTTPSLLLHARQPHTRSPPDFVTAFDNAASPNHNASLLPPVTRSTTLLRKLNFYCIW